MTDKEKLTELLRSAINRTDRSWNTVIPDCLVEAVAEGLLAHGVTVQGWIPVTERLPENEQTVKKHIEGNHLGFLTVLTYNGVVKQTNRFFCDETRCGLPKTNGWEGAKLNMTNKCVCCGDEVPEGLQVCLRCQRIMMEMKEKHPHRWIKRYSRAPMNGEYFCSRCRYVVDIATGKETPADRGFLYCPACGQRLG